MNSIIFRVTPKTTVIDNFPRTSLPRTSSWSRSSTAWAHLVSTLNLNSKRSLHYYRNIMPFDFIVITITYDVLLIGFMTLGTGSSMPGNLGFWDQTLALRFVHENITAFGGHPSKVTAVGLSAGAASVAALSLSPHSRGNLFAV